MFTPSSLTIALLMMITSAVCWGSWANTFKGVKNYRFELVLLGLCDRHLPDFSDSGAHHGEHRE